MLPEQATCTQINTCVTAAVSCKAGSGKLPDCYEAPLLSVGQSLCATVVALAWNEGRYVVIVDGLEFSF